MTTGVSSALPWATLSRRALAAAATEALAVGGSIADLRRDAWGHGLRPVAEALHAAGASGAIVDDGESAALVRRTGLEALPSGGPDIDPAVLYGLPGAGTAPVMRLTGRVLSTKPLYAGEAVSYGYTHRAEADTTLALVTGGYAQGIVRALGNHAHVEIDGALRRIVGRVAMDVCVVDLGGAGIEEGAEVIFFGGSGAARDGLAEWAAITGMTAGELIAVVGARTSREWSA